MQEDIIINEKSILLGFFGGVSNLNAINAIILLAKWHVFKNKLAGTEMFFYKFLCDLKYFLIIEKTISIKQGQLYQYTQTWQQIEDYIT